jgi:hypothetical protein
VQSFLVVFDRLHAEAFATQSHFQIAPDFRVAGDHQDDLAVNGCEHKRIGGAGFSLRRL